MRNKLLRIFIWLIIMAAIYIAICAVIANAKFSGAVDPFTKPPAVECISGDATMHARMDDVLSNYPERADPEAEMYIALGPDSCDKLQPLAPVENRRYMVWFLGSWHRATLIDCQSPSDAWGEPFTVDIDSAFWRYQTRRELGREFITRLPAQVCRLSW